MKIVHIDFTGTFNEDMLYQGNLLAKYNVLDGHSVTIITTCYKWDTGVIIRVSPEDTIIGNGIRLIRLPYKQIISNFLTKKIRFVNGLYAVLSALSPDIIMLHGLQTFSAIPILKYIHNTNVTFYSDSHTDLHNSAKNFISRNILHKIIYKYIARYIAKNSCKVLCCSQECMSFLTDIYNIRQDYLEFFPLGGQCKPDYTYNEIRKRIRAEEQISKDTILYLHSGKMDTPKRTYEIVRAFNNVFSKNAKLYLIGLMPESIEHNVMSIVDQNPNIKYLGWKTGEELENYLCAADVYLQPGSQSATMQNAACSRCALALYPHPSHTYLWGEDKVFYVETKEDMERLFKNISEHPEIVDEMRQRSYAHAEDILDYRKLAARIYR